SRRATTRYPVPLSWRFTVRGLNNKRVLITGGASGIGAATAARFLEEGSQVVVLDRDEKGRSAIQRQLPKLAGAVAADVSKLDQGGCHRAHQNHGARTCSKG